MFFIETRNKFFILEKHESKKFENRTYMKLAHLLLCFELKPKPIIFE